MPKTVVEFVTWCPISKDCGRTGQLKGKGETDQHVRQRLFEHLRYSDYHGLHENAAIELVNQEAIVEKRTYTWDTDVETDDNDSAKYKETSRRSKLQKPWAPSKDNLPMPKASASKKRKVLEDPIQLQARRFSKSVASISATGSAQVKADFWEISKKMRQIAHELINVADMIDTAQTQVEERPWE
jgi:hypothetical protein